MRTGIRVIGAPHVKEDTLPEGVDHRIWTKSGGDVQACLYLSPGVCSYEKDWTCGSTRHSFRLQWSIAPVWKGGGIRSLQLRHCWYQGNHTFQLGRITDGWGQRFFDCYIDGDDMVYHPMCDWMPQRIPELLAALHWLRFVRNRKRRRLVTMLFTSLLPPVLLSFIPLV